MRDFWLRVERAWFLFQSRKYAAVRNGNTMLLNQSSVKFQQYPERLRRQQEGTQTLPHILAQPYIVWFQTKIILFRFIVNDALPRKEVGMCMYQSGA